MRNAFVIAWCAVALALVGGGRGGQVSAAGQAQDDVSALAAKVQQLTDLEAVRAIPSCYGFGHDLISRDIGGQHREALDALRRCHAEDLVTHVFLLDETKAATDLHSLPELVGFIDTFWQQQGYSSARNVPGNVQVEFTGPDSARVLSSTVAPHFVTKRGHEPATDFVEARYVQKVVRGADGVWRVVEFDLVVQQISRAAVTYPFARP